MKKAFLIFVLAVLPATAYAVNMSLFKDTPVARLTADEVEAFHGTLLKTLDEAPDGSTVEWTAPTTPFTSKITPQKRFADGQFECRKTRIESRVKGRSERGLYTFCKVENGEWQFRVPSSRK